MSTEREILGLDNLVHDQLLYTHSSGVTDTKASWLGTMKSGMVKYKSVTCSERKVRFFGDVALMNGRAAIEVDIGGQGWKFVAWQSCPQPTA